jgi:hypothetical protein
MISGVDPSQRGLLIISVYRPDLYEDALRSIGFARDLVIVLDRRVGERRRHDRAIAEGAIGGDRRRLRVDDQLSTAGWVLISDDDSD